MATVFLYLFWFTPTFIIWFILYLLVNKLLHNYSVIYRILTFLVVYVAIGIFFLYVYFIPDTGYDRETDLIHAAMWPTAVSVALFKPFH